MSVSKIGSYVIDGQLGAGAAGTAYRAHHEDTGLPAAVKLLSHEMTKDETMQRRFVREMKLLEKLEHPNIVRYFEGGLFDGRFYYAMELVEFGTLKDVLQKRQHLTWQEAAECGVQICNALQCADQEDIVHRDLKPLNLFLSEDGLIKLGDFGLARDLKSETLTLDGTTVGTVLYMAPEQIQGLEITHATDIYALGCLLYEMLSGRVPFAGNNTMAILEQHFHADPPDVRDVMPNVPKALADLLVQMMAKDPAERPADASLVGDQLQRILATSRVASESVGESDERSSNLTDRLIDVSTSERTRSPKLLMAIVLIVVSLVIVGVAMSQ